MRQRWAQGLIGASYEVSMDWGVVNPVGIADMDGKKAESIL